MSEKGLESSGDVTALLDAWSRKEPEALGRLIEEVQRDLHVLAVRLFRGERADHTLQPTALLNELFLRLLGSRSVQWENREQFFFHARELMRRILLDSARRHRAAKRGGSRVRVELEEGHAATLGAKVLHRMAVAEALQQLKAEDPLAYEIAELRLYLGLSHQEIGEKVGLAAATVKKRWGLARVRLRRILNEAEEESPSGS